MEDGLEVRVRERLDPVEWAHRAVPAQNRRLADLQMDVAGAELDGTLENCIQVHGAIRGCIGSPGRPL